MIFLRKYMGVLILTTIRVIKITNVTISPLADLRAILWVLQVTWRANECIWIFFKDINEFND